MCFPLGCCCMPRTLDDDLAPASRTQVAHHHNGNGGGHYNDNGHHYNGNGNGGHTTHMPAAAEAGRKASNDVRAHGAATGAQETLKQQQHAASNGRVAAVDGHGARGGAPHNYYDRAHLPAHREDAADSHYYPAATATADHERY